MPPNLISNRKSSNVVRMRNLKIQFPNKCWAKPAKLHFLFKFIHQTILFTAQKTTNLVKFMDNILDPLRCHLNIVINAGLMVNATTESSAGDSNQSVFAIFHQNESTAAVAQTGILFPVRVARTKHLLIQFDENVLLFMPIDAFRCT